MKKVKRQDLVDFETYEDQRAETRAQVMAEKARRRVEVGPYLTFLFETFVTIRYQVQEMMRTERIVREADIEHELATYNELLGERGQLGCTLLIGIEDAAERARLLRAWLELPRHLYIRTSAGALVRPTFDPRQVGEDRLSSVQYLKFEVGDADPVAVGSDLPGHAVEAVLGPEQRSALVEDLRT